MKKKDGATKRKRLEAEESREDDGEERRRIKWEGNGTWIKDKEASIGYMGHDEFAIIETSLARRFPIYKDGDTNNDPTGGTRQIEYKLKDGEASRLFVIDEISAY